MSLQKKHTILITGGNGFIGSHVASHLFNRGYRIHIADINRQSYFTTKICDQLYVGNLCDPAFCARIVRGVHTVLHFAANMGGMGVIHPKNDVIIYSENHIMTLNLLAACVNASVKKFLYASSACVYPEVLQQIDNSDVSLREGDVWTNGIPHPQGLYGLEKLNSELLLEQYRSVLDIRIARFHNVYGPGGAWKNGREKAPAAMVRKALAIKLTNRSGETPLFEIWGDGSQRRSFLFIDDCVEAVVRYLRSDCKDTVNIGSSDSVTIQELANLALQSVDVDVASVRFQFDSSKPLGVGSRNSNNDLVYEKLGWTPQTTLKEGIRKTAEWMESQMLLENFNDPSRDLDIQRLRSSQVVDLESENTTFAILLPITSRGLESPADCLENLTEFARSLERTTWRDTHQLGGTKFRIRIYVAIDHDDEYLLRAKAESKIEAIFLTCGINDVVTLICDYPRGSVCSLWRHCARQAWKDRCDYFVLMGDDVVVEDEGWMRDAHAVFLDMANDQDIPPGFGVVAFTDVSFPGMPTFPIVGRAHLDAFDGEVVPRIFINQDGDPYLFQLYRRWGCAQMFKSRIRNKLGGSNIARYAKEHAADWTYDTLNSSSAFLEGWIRDNDYTVQRRLTIDVIVPSYRVQPNFLEPILQLRSSSTCAVMFIIIIDDPTSPRIVELEQKYGHRPDIRIRVNSENLGASASRNRGMMESAAEWVHFLDDDVHPRPDLLLEAEKAIRASPSAAGFVGNSQFPPADGLFTAAIHLSGVTYFWDISTKIDRDVPWGVTANLIARRNKDGVFYDVGYPKTGGGEDIDFCRRKREKSLAEGLEGFHAAPAVVVTHPWWACGRRSYRRFFMWSFGDGRLVKQYPEHRYRDAAPNSAELLLYCAAIFLMGGLYAVVKNDWHIILFPLRAIFSVVIANVLHDCYRHLWREKDGMGRMKTTVRGVWWFVAVVDSAILRMVSEAGRTVGILRRREFTQLGHRFDWFTGRFGMTPIEDEKRNSLQRLYLVLLITVVLSAF